MRKTNLCDWCIAKKIFQCIALSLAIWIAATLAFATLYEADLLLLSYGWWPLITFSAGFALGMVFLWKFLF